MIQIEESKFDELIRSQKWWRKLSTERWNLIRRIDAEIELCMSAPLLQKNYESLDVRERALRDVLGWMGEKAADCVEVVKGGVK